MSTQPLLSNLVFTKSIGNCDDSHDTSFNDAIQYGQFPANFIIKGIKQIDAFSNGNKDDAVITGLTIRYDGVDNPVSHGLVTNMTNIGTLTIDPNEELLVGIYGRLKKRDGKAYDKRIASIGFVVFDKGTGKVHSEDPWHGSYEYLGTPWATFGPIVAFQGTTKDGVGLTTLGFVKYLDGVPGNVDVLGSNKSAKQAAHIL